MRTETFSCCFTAHTYIATYSCVRHHYTTLMLWSSSCKLTNVAFNQDHCIFEGYDDLHDTSLQAMMIDVTVMMMTGWLRYL